MDIRVPARPPWRYVASTEVEKFVPNLRNKEQGPPLPSKPLDGALHPDEHRVPEIGYQRLREGPLQASDQLSVR